MYEVNVLFPKDLVAIKGYHGYFYDLKNQILYSIKVGGVLRELKLHLPNKFNKATGPFYELSVNGRKRYLLKARIESLLISPYVIPFK